jgi:hypothetical protein
MREQCGGRGLGCRLRRIQRKADMRDPGAGDIVLSARLAERVERRMGTAVQRQQRVGDHHAQEHHVRDVGEQPYARQVHLERG